MSEERTGTETEREKNICILKRKQSEEEEKRRGSSVSNSAHLLSGGAVRR